MEIQIRLKINLDEIKFQNSEIILFRLLNQYTIKNLQIFESLTQKAAKIKN